MNQIELTEGTTRDHSLSQFFTPPKLAQRLVDWAGIADPSRGPYSQPYRVLEPSAGNGAIVRPLVAAGAEVHAVEIDLRYMQELCDLMVDSACHRLWCGDDFLKIDPVYLATRYDLVCGNFPFHADQAGEFTLHALKFAPRVVAIYPSNVFYSAKRSRLWSQVRPTRIAHTAKRPWPGATDYVALELVRRVENARNPQLVKVEWWHESWT
jgi:predicted RNA methylase